MKVLTELGAEVEAVDLGESVDELGARVGHIIGIEGYSWVGTFVDDPSQPIDPDIRPRIQLGRDRSAVDYLERLREQQAFKQAVEARTRHLDAMLSPAVASRHRLWPASTKIKLPRRSHALSIIWSGAQWSCHVAPARTAYRCRYRLPVEAMRNPWRYKLALLTNAQQLGTTTIRSCSVIDLSRA